MGIELTSHLTCLHLHLCKSYRLYTAILSCTNKSLIRMIAVCKFKNQGIVGLLFIEREEEMRPSMEQVLRMLEGKMDPQTLQMKMLSCAVKDRTETDSGSNDTIV
ncbi:hypothetical protein SUGI_0536350 [Cryptomeria japonica]|nr:hypothetical protein SUGI_0536350 [Cryptomeria japonica]